MPWFHPGRPVASRAAPPAGLAAPVAAASIAVFIAAPWLDQGLVWCEWLGVTAALLLIGHTRGWQGQLWTLASAAAALAIAFHWTPEVLAYAMNAEPSFGLLVATPLVLWDAARLALPFCFAARVAANPLQAWLPAGTLAAALEGVVPAVFPWKLGYSQIAWPPLVQVADLLGAEFTTFTLFAHAGTLAWLLHAAGRTWRSTRWPAISFPPTSQFAVAVSLLTVAYGIGTIAFWERRMAEVPTLAVALVQANPDDEDGVDALRSLTHRCAAGTATPDLACWPECSGGSYEEGLDSLADAGRVASASRPPRQGMQPLETLFCPLLFGGKIYRGHPDKPRALHQSAILIDASAAIRGTYHKRHLMPFGEYVPGSELYPDIERHFAMQDEITAGSEARVLAWDETVRLGVMLCYEDMIPDAARSLANRSANLLVSLINGSAFTAPLTLVQHRLLAQLRAVECRRCLVRCAATGETCVIAPTGRVVAALPLHTRGVLQADVPLLESTTLACRLGPAFPLACGVATVVMACCARHGSSARLPIGGTPVWAAGGPGRCAPGVGSVCSRALQEPSCRHTPASPDFEPSPIFASTSRS
jgi:apolipoprotein N-acyltransferase